MNDEVKTDMRATLKLQLISLFSIPVVKTNINRSFTKKEIDCITSIPMKETKEEKTRKEKEGGTKEERKRGRGRQSESYEILDKFAEELKDIKTFCEYELKRYLEDIEGVNTDITNLRITHAWLNKVKPQECTDLHSHANSHLSGILYIRCLPNDNIQFTNVYHRYWMQLPIKKATQSNTEGISVNIKEGDLILFPSWVPHQVGVNETENKERVALSFDTWPTYLPSVYYPYK